MSAATNIEKFGLTYIEASKYSGASVRKLAEEIKLGKLRAFKPGKEVQITKSDLDAWIKKQAIK
jgi:excisionase family DNA binding protein